MRIVALGLVPSLGRTARSRTLHHPAPPTKTDVTVGANRPAYPPRSNVPFVLGIDPA